MALFNQWSRDAFGRMVHKQWKEPPDPDPNWRVMTGYYCGYELWRARVRWASL